MHASSLLIDAPPPRVIERPVMREVPVEVEAAAPAIEKIEDRRLPLDAPVESSAKRIGSLLAAIVIAVGFFWVTQSYWAPAHPGIDQNGYMVGGRMFAKTFSTGFKPDNPFQYVGGMWVMTDDGWVYPKYPLGVPILTAACLWIGGETHGPAMAYLVAPVCASAATLAMFLLAREIAGSFAGLLAQLLLASNPILLAMANSPWSHASAIAFVTWGMLFTLWWWRSGGAWRGAIGGFLLGYAVLIRYTEGLLLLPLAIAAVSRLRWRDARSYARCAVPMVAWLLPVAYLLIFNKLAMGSWTGYDTTNESTGFQLSKLAERWPNTLDLLYQSGLYFVFPIGVLGMLLLFRWNWRVGLYLAAWFVPAAALYTAYYWGDNARGMGGLRFYLTILPPLIAAACWVLSLSPSPGTPGEGRGEGHFARVIPPLAAGIIVAISAVTGAREALPQLERDFTINTNLADAREVLRLHTKDFAPADAVLFADGQMFMSAANYLQFATGFEVYAANAFTNDVLGVMRRGPIGPGGTGGVDGDPNPIQPKRREYLRQEYAKYDDAKLVEKQNEVMRNALARGRRVFALLTENEAERFQRRYVGENFASVVLATWREPVKWTEPAINPQDQRRSGGPGGGGGGGPGGAFGGGRRQQDNRGPWMNNSATPRSMRLIEITRK